MKYDITDVRIELTGRTLEDGKPDQWAVAELTVKEVTFDTEAKVRLGVIISPQAASTYGEIEREVRAKAAEMAKQIAEALRLDAA